MKSKDVIIIKEEGIDSSTRSVCDNDMMAWVKFEDISLMMADKRIIEEGHMAE